MTNQFMRTDFVCNGKSVINHLSYIENVDKIKKAFRKDTNIHY